MTGNLIIRKMMKALLARDNRGLHICVTKTAGMGLFKKLRRSGTRLALRFTEICTIIGIRKKR